MDRSIRILMLLVFLWLSGLGLSAAATAQTTGKKQKKADPNGYDIAVVIDNRVIAGSPSAEEDVKAITDMLDRHMFADHIIQLERPSFPTICDIFGGCPNETNQLWPSLIAQVADPKRSRLFVYYLGPARLEGQARELLFEDGPGNKSPYTVGWLHKQLEKTEPKSALVMMETSFSPRPLPCASENPELIDQTMTTISRNYRKLMEGRGLPRKLAELSATLPGQAPHCDRYELISGKIERPIFTKFLLKGVVEGNADEDDDGMIELGELSAYTQAKISRAVQFQWGREQTVWLTGSESRVIARVKPREATFKEKPPKKHKLPEPRPERPRPPKASAEPKKEVAREPVIPSHICDLDPAAEGCLKFCADNPDNFRCGFIGVDVCLDQPIGADCPCALHDPRQGCADEVAKCQWSDPELALDLSRLVAAVGGSPDNICQWATRDETEIEASVPWKLFAPIGWRLVRPSVRPSVGCLLNCAGDAGQADISTSEAAPPVAVLIEMSEQDLGTVEVDEQAFEPPLLSPRTAFEEEVCDEALPPHIGIPRWMPGTLAISETFRFFSDCELERLMTFATPPPVTLVDAPPVPRPTYLPPPPFALPPPVILPPIKQREQPAIALPVFEPTVSQTRWLQSALTLGNHNPGPIDGAMGDQTEEAIQSWRETKASTIAQGALSELEFNLIVKEFGDLFDQVHPGASLY